MMTPALSARILASVFLLPMFIGCGGKPAAPPVASMTPAPRPVARRTVAAATYPATVPTTAFFVNPDVFPDTTNPRETLPFLASDALAGRLPGTPGLQRAGDFLATELEHIGLQPLPGRSDYFQPFNMPGLSTLELGTRLALNGQDLLLAKDYVPMSPSAAKTFAGNIVFAGFGITRAADDASHYDDYAGLDVRGKVVLALMKEPLDEKSASRFTGQQGQWSESAHFATKAKNAADHGAVALLLVAPPFSGGDDKVRLFAGSEEEQSTIPVLQITRRVANVILSMGNAEDLKTIQDVIDTSFKPHSIDLPTQEVAGQVAIKQTVVRNVVACLPGTGPHADEWVVVGAHYDHLGKGQMGHMVGGRVGSIWHGADDNASGTTAILELAEKMKKAGPLPRSVLFIWFTGEEEGLIGSKYFVDHPPIPLEKIAAMLNLDMVGRLRKNALEIGGGATAANLDSIVQAAVAGTEITTSIAPAMDGGRGGMGPSDHASFAAHRIPVLFLFTGMHIDYHQPSDTADKINYDGIDKLVDVSQRIVISMANMPRQIYNDSSDRSIMAMMMGGGRSAALGVMPDESAAQGGDGVPITGVIKGGPAEAAGFRAGDVIVAFNSKTVKSLGDLSESLHAAHGGDKVMVKVLRDGKAVEMLVMLVER